MKQRIDSLIATVNELRSEIGQVNPVELQNRLWDLTIEIREQLIKIKEEQA